jgi:hypothetical protein
MESPMSTAADPDLPEDLLQVVRLLREAFGDVAVLGNELDVEPWMQQLLDGDGAVSGYHAEAFSIARGRCFGL